jgi:hypothetical protein
MSANDAALHFTAQKTSLKPTAAGQALMKKSTAQSSKGLILTVYARKSAAPNAEPTWGMYLSEKASQRRTPATASTASPWNSSQTKNEYSSSSSTPQMIDLRQHLKIKRKNNVWRSGNYFLPFAACFAGSETCFFSFLFMSFSRCSFLCCSKPSAFFAFLDKILNLDKQ